MTRNSSRASIVAIGSYASGFTIGPLYACICQVPGAGSRFECNQYDPDPMRAKIEFVEFPSRKR